MADYYTVLTTVGENKLANASVTGPRVRPAEVAVGDGGGPSFYDDYGRTALKARTSLVNEQFRTAVNDLRVETDNPNWVVVDGVIPADEGGYNIREVGVIDEDGDLIAIGRFPQTFKPVLDSGAFQDMIVRIIMEVSDVAALTLQVDPSAVLATRSFVLEQRRPFVRTPVIESPSDGAGGLTTEVVIDGSVFAPLYSVDTREWRQFQIQAAGGDWSTPLVDEQLDQDDYTFTANPDTAYEARIRDRRTGGPTTDWSTVVEFTTADTYIETPTNVAPADNATDIEEQPTLEGSAFTVIGGSDTHVNSRFRIYDVATATLVHDSGVIPATVTYTVPANVLEANLTEYEWEVQYEGDVLGWSGNSTRTSFTTQDSFLAVGPGPQEMVAYDETTDTGYYGEVAVADLFSGDELASAIGLSAGVSQHSTTGWLKFYVGPNASCYRPEDAQVAGQGYTVFIAKRPYRNDLDWDSIYQAGAVYGTDDNGLYPTGTPQNQLTTVTTGGNTFKVQLMTGAEDDPTSWTGTTTTDPVEGETSYWNELMYRVHVDVPARQNGVNWDSLTDSDIVVASGNGRYSWMQETRADSTSNRASRGSASVSNFNTLTSYRTLSSVGWRPCLVIVS